MKNPLNSKSFKILKEKGFKKWILYRFIKIQAILLNLFPFLFKVLPGDYKFVIYCFSTSGHTALNYFLSLCGLNKVELYHDVLDYINIREKLKKEDKNFYLHLFFSRKKQFIPNFSYILNPTKILILTRDPISRFKTFINHGKSSNNTKIINLNDDLDKVFKISYIGKNDEYEIKPSLEALKYWKNSNKTLNFNYYSNIKAFLESKKEFKIFYIDCKELDSKIAFDTMN
ncbi:hypothetical protein GQV94_04780, partial [Campylobacter sp. TTU_617]|nr:hypothetical protein [Campylobacter sp. TTU_617]